MAIVLDLIGSTIIGGLLILTMLRMNASGMENQSYFAEDLLVQENLREIVKIIESDFRKIGYGINPDNNGNIQMDQIFLICQTGQLRFQADMNWDGNPDVVDYTLGNFMTQTPNDSDRYLWRTVSSDPNPRTNVASGLVRFELRYMAKDNFRFLGPITATNIDSIGAIEITIALQSPYAVIRVGQSKAQSYRETTTLWRQTRLIARNLNR
jgi:hypothetical protein